MSKTPFPALATNQRPSLVRLASGRLFFAGDYQDRQGLQPEAVKERGAFVALSDDDGRTWKMKKLPGTLPHESYSLAPPERRARMMSSGTLGYSVAAQAPNGVIHLVTSMNHPSQHFEMNEAWILAGDNAVVQPAGPYRLNGTETWRYPNGARQYEVTWKDGVKVGEETYWSKDGKTKWKWVHQPDGLSVWTQYWPNGNRSHESSWRDGKCIGKATAWKWDGTVAGTYQFADGALVK